MNKLMCRFVKLIGIIAIAWTFVGCTSWQETIIKDGFIPLPKVALMKLVESDTEKTGGHRLVNQGGLVGTSLEFNVNNFIRTEKILTYDYIPDLTRKCDFPLVLWEGPKHIKQELGGNIDLKIPPIMVGNVDINLGGTNSLGLENLWSIQLDKGVEDDNLQDFLAQLILDMNDRRSKEYLILTKVLVADLDQSKNIGLNVGFEKLSYGLKTGFGKKVKVNAYGCALGVKGQLITKKYEGVEGRKRLMPGETRYRIGNDEILLTLDSSSLKIQCSNIIGEKLYIKQGKNWVNETNPILLSNLSDEIMLWNLNDAGGKIIAFEVNCNGNNIDILSGVSYRIDLQPFDYNRLKDKLLKKEEEITVDVKEWGDMIGENAPIKQFEALQAQVLVPPEPLLLLDEACVDSYDVVEILVPNDGDRKYYDNVHLLRFDARHLAGKKYRCESLRKGGVGDMQGKVFGKDKNGDIKDIPLSSAYMDLEQSIIIPENMDYLYICVYRQRKWEPVDMIGFARGRYCPVNSLNWTIAFLPPSGKNCRLFFGRNKPMHYEVGTSEKTKLPGWVVEILKNDGTSPVLKKIQNCMMETFNVYSFNELNIRDNIGWIAFKEEIIK